jgi:hypothetical protein
MIDARQLDEEIIVVSDDALNVDVVTERGNHGRFEMPQQVPSRGGWRTQYASRRRQAVPHGYEPELVNDLSALGLRQTFGENGCVRPAESIRDFRGSVGVPRQTFAICSGRVRHGEALFNGDEGLKCGSPPLSPTHDDARARNAEGRHSQTHCGKFERHWPGIIPRRAWHLYG